MNHTLATAAIFGATLTVTPTLEARVLAFQCESPRGHRASYGDTFGGDGAPLQSKTQGVVWAKDGFDNTYPAVIWDMEKPDEILLSWGSAVPDYIAKRINGDLSKEDAWHSVRESIEESRMFKAWAVTYKDDNQIQVFDTSCGVAGSCAASLLTLFPKVGFLTLSRSQYSGTFLHPKDEAGSVSMFAASCRRLG